MNVSVIIPTYNRNKHILNAIKSIQEQTVKIDEIIVVDDGSTDNSKELLENENIKYIYQENQGVSAARNRGIKEAKNDWIAFLDSDDTWHNEKLENHIDIHKKDKLLLASYTDEQWVRNGKIINLKSYQQKEEPTFLNSLRLCKIGTSTFFCNKKIFEKIGSFDENLRACEDYDLWLRILKEDKIKFIDKKLTIKNAGHENQLSFETKYIDTYRIKALKKHLDSKYKNEVIDELIYKISILLKGARKYNNINIIDEYEKLQEYISNLNLR